MLLFSSLIHRGGLSLSFVVIEVVLLLIASGICSGLNIAVMSLDINDLKRKAKLGNKQAKKVLPLRAKTHLTLAAILLTNIAAVSATTLALDQRLSGWLAGVLATLLIVIIGEVLPQALFAKNPLVWSSRFAPVLKAMVYITYIVSKPLETLLNRLFPDEKVKLQSRHELGLLINEHLIDDSSELDENEIEIMRGALSLSEKKVKDIMTDVKDTYWLSTTDELRDLKIDEIKAKGFSRIPVFNKELSICYGVLLMKELVDIDFDENSYKVEDMTLHPVQLVGSKTALDTLFRKFITAGSHLIPVEKDDRIIGIVTIEDLIEEIFGQEIEDETDRQKRLSKDRV
jgi:metal transporter CNNM